jgi:DNA-binding XRE family transcriptional regulator
MVSACGHPATYWGYLVACRESLPRVVIAHHPNAIRSTTTKLSANNLTTIFTRRSSTMAAVKIDGTKLKHLRERRFISREELAEKVGSHRDHIGRLERGEIANPRMTTIRNLAEALGVDPAELVE